MAIKQGSTQGRGARTFRAAVTVFITVLVVEAAAVGVSIMDKLGGRDPGASALASINPRPMPGPEGELVKLPPQPPIIAEVPQPAVLTPPEPDPVPMTTSAGEILDPQVRELVLLGRALRKDGDTQLALESLLAAAADLPNHPLVMSELALTYDLVGLNERAAEYWQKVYDLGEKLGEDFYHLASMKLLSSATEAAARSGELLKVTDVYLKKHPEVHNGEQVTLRISIRAQPNAVIVPSDVHIYVQFYDVVNNNTVEETTAEPPKDAWVTAPIDWSGHPEEVLEVVYFHPTATLEEIRAYGARKFYGFETRVYYANTLQDSYTAPAELADLLKPPVPDNDQPLLDGSLFPSRTP